MKENAQVTINMWLPCLRTTREDLCSQKRRTYDKKESSQESNTFSEKCEASRFAKTNGARFRIDIQRYGDFHYQQYGTGMEFLLQPSSRLIRILRS